ncbi:hypothetical protein RN001_015172 [Aquatica leii]|uniref:THAP-type domain-containing protein n=1 Tax=Aquatica leii TaxID=1421715 RepID=A0AAN7P1G1_9COLE|nr:hypothetical protein RN001_015172 [Aquatica leii]
MVTCSVYNCNSSHRRKEQGISFHRFPIDPTKRHVWIFNINRKDWVPSKNDRLCSRHFEQRYIYQTNEKMRLLNNAVPTLFLPSTKQSQSKESIKQYSSEDITSNHDPLALSSVETNLEPLNVVKPTITDSPLPSTTVEATATSQKQDLDKILCRVRKKNLEMSKTIKILRQSLRRSNKKIASLKSVIKSLKTNFVSEENVGQNYFLINESIKMYKCNQCDELIHSLDLNEDTNVKDFKCNKCVLSSSV